MAESDYIKKKKVIEIAYKECETLEKHIRSENIKTTNN